jgi:heme exporter protein C
MFVLYLGYLAVRRLPADETTQSRRSAVACLIAVVDLPINYMAATWWQTLHQQASIGNPESGTTVHGLMLETMLLGFVAFTLLYAWLVGHRMRTLGLERDLGDADLALALSERLTEIVGPAERPAGKPASTSLSGSRR